VLDDLAWNDAPWTYSIVKKGVASRPFASVGSKSSKSVTRFGWRILARVRNSDFRAALAALSRPPRFSRLSVFSAQGVPRSVSFAR